MFKPGPFKGDQRKHQKIRPASEIKAEIEKILADFRKSYKGDKQ